MKVKWALASVRAVASALSAPEFAALLAPLGPWDGPRRVAVAVSGGADSLCLALLARGWGDPTAFIIDHGLRPEAAAEAAWTAATLQSKGIPARVITLNGLQRGPAMAARARTARYAALTAACREVGLVDLLLGHHAGDQAETILMRRRQGSGPAGLAGMAALTEHHSVRLVRPLLGTAPDRLRQTLRQVSQAWVEDPSNADPQATRSRLRAELAGQTPDLGHDEAAARTVAEAAAAAELAHRAAIHPAGFAIVSPGPLSPAALGALLRAIGGHGYPPAPRAVAALAAGLRSATLAGVRLLPAGRLGPGWLLVREAAALAGPVPLADGAVWDRRFRVTGAVASGCTLGALGPDAAQFRRRCCWPSAILYGLPAIRCNNVLCVVPHLAYGLGIAKFGLEMGMRLHHAGLPVAGEPFVAF